MVRPAQGARRVQGTAQQWRTETANVVRPPQWQSVEFVASMAHDMRGPLATITTSAELLEQDLQAEDSAHLLTIIQRQASRLQQMIQDLSESMAMQESSIQIHPEVTDLGDLIREIGSEFQRLENNHTLTLELPAAPVPANVDSEKVRRILQNLLRNAFRYSPQGTIVTARLRLHDHASAVIEVEDQGPGVPEAARKDVFKRFFRLDSNSHIDGHGLGLYIVRCLAEAHGGLAWVEGGSLGGARFCVSLPLV
jgi:two-component system OmpR family sensor kinase